MTRGLPLLSSPKEKIQKNNKRDLEWHYSLVRQRQPPFAALLCSRESQMGFSSLLSYWVPPAFQLSLSPTSPAITCWSSHPAIAAAEFHFSDLFSCEIPLALSFPSLIVSFYLCLSLALLSLFAFPAVLFKRNLSENQAKKT